MNQEDEFTEPSPVHLRLDLFHSKAVPELQKKNPQYPNRPFLQSAWLNASILKHSSFFGELSG